MISNSQEKDTFQKFGGSVFQTKLIQSLLLDIKFFTRIYEILKKDYFTSKTHQFLFEKIHKYYEEYKLIPSIDNLEIILASEEDKLIRETAHEILKVIRKSSVADTSMIKKEALMFCKQQKMKAAILESVDHLEKNNFEDIYKVIGDALKAGDESDKGHIYFEELDRRLEKVKREIIPTGLQHLDEILNGGAGKGELLVVLGGPGIGKSAIMIKMGAQAILAGKNVAHYTLELYEHQVGVRYDSIFSGLSIDDVPHNKEFVKKKLDEIQNHGKLYIKEYATKTASVNGIRLDLNKARMDDFIPDLVIVDYADLVRGRAGMSEKRFILESIYEDLRALAYEFNVPVITGSAANKSESNSEIITIISMAESFAKAAVADIIITISRLIEDKMRNTARMYVAKNRAGRDGIVIPLNPFNIGLMQIETQPAITSTDELKKEIEKLSTEENDILKKSLEKKYKIFRNKNKEGDKK